MSTPEFVHQKAMDAGPHLPILMHVYNEVIANGHTTPFMPLTKDDQCMYVLREGNCIGGMVYTVSQGVLWIVLSFVRPDLRGNGIYGEMFSEIEAHAKRVLGCKQISSLVSADNAAQIQASTKSGMVAKWHRMQKEI